MSRAHPLRVLPANRALLARPERSPVRVRRGRLLPALSTLRRALTPPSLSTSFTPRRVAPPCPRVRPRNPRACALLFPQSLAIQPPWLSRAAERPGTERPGRTPPRFRLSVRHRSPPPPTGTRGRAPRLRPSRGLARSRRGLSPAQADGHSAASPRPPSPRAPALAAVRGERAPGRRVPSSGFSRLLSVR